MDWMAVSSYGAGTQSSGVVRILKDLDTDIKGKHVLIVEDIIDSGLNALLAAVEPRLPRAGLAGGLHPLRKPDAAKGRQQPGERQTRVDDVLDNQDVLALDVGVQVLEDPDDTGGLRGPRRTRTRPSSPS